MKATGAIIYQVFVRNYTEEGNLKAVTNHLEELLSTGMDVLYLMPICPIGVLGRKGRLGSPYAIQDYFKIDPLQGNEEDFRELCTKLHEKKKKLILDMVFNHTSRDSVLSRTHPEYFYHDKNGHFANKVGDWEDVIDLDHHVKGLDEELIRVLKHYQDLGCDGFRFDVGSFLPPSFYSSAKKALGKDTIFLAECVDTKFLNYTRSLGFDAFSNEELHEAGVDFFYPYASFEPLRKFLETKNPICLQEFKYAFEMEEAALSRDAYIVRCIENHDRDRIASYSKDKAFLHSELLYTFFSDGPAFVYMGEEYKAEHKPDLFEKDVISHEIKDRDYYDFYQRLVSLKKRVKMDLLLTTTVMESPLSTMILKDSFKEEKTEFAVLNFSEKEVRVPFENGVYLDLLTGKNIKVKNGYLDIREPLWLTRLD